MGTVVTVPSTPISGTADPNPLLTQAQYQQDTGDTASSAPNFTAALADALDMVQRRLKRTLLYAQYTERLFVYRNGIVYPSARPLDQSKLANSSASTPGNSIFQGAGIWVGWFVPLPSLPVWEGVVPPQTDITYWGGYSGPSSAQAAGTYGPLLPAKLRRAIEKVVWYLLHPTMLPGLPGGIRSMNVGGVSMSGAELDAMVDADPQLRRDLRGFRNDLGRHFDQ